VRRNHLFDARSELWLDRQPNASAALRELIHARIDAEELGALPGKGFSANDRAALKAEILAELLAELPRNVTELRQVDTGPANGSTPPDVPATEQDRMRATAGRNVSRLIRTVKAQT
jgi:hypothetical protein